MKGPFITSLVTPGSKKVKWTYRSDSTPYLHPLPYKTYEVRKIRADEIASGFTFDPFDRNPGNSRGKAFNAAYAKFVSRLKPDASQLGASLAERAQSANMASKRLSQLWEFTRAVIRRDPRRALKALGLHSLPKRKRFRRVWDKYHANKGRENVEDASDLWLELHFGWVPLIQDLHNAVKTLKDGVPRPIVIGTGSSPYNVRAVVDEAHYKHFIHTSVRCRIEAKVRIANSDVWMLNQQGLINPASVAWEIVPFSFVVDWFFNVGSVLSSLTDLAGLSVIDPQVTYHVTTYEERRTIDTTKKSPDVVVAFHGRSFERELGIGKPRLRFNGFSPFSVPRLGTALALVVQQLKKVGRPAPPEQLKNWNDYAQYG